MYRQNGANTMEKIKQIEASEVYQQIMQDSFGGIMYNVDNRDKYDAAEVLTIWNSLTAAEKELAGGILKGAVNFLEGN
jgi:hypothetical protein